MTAYRMFCAAYRGDLALGHIDVRADSVRNSVKALHQPPHGAGGWRRAKAEGWRVVPVKVEMIKARA